jgi:hypothetical protein
MMLANSTKLNVEDKNPRTNRNTKRKRKRSKNVRKEGEKRGHRTIMKTWRSKHLQELTNPPARKYISVVPGMNQLDTRLHVRL